MQGILSDGVITMEDKIRVSQALIRYPFLASLIQQTGWSKAAYCRVTIKIDEPIDLSTPFHDGCVRYTSTGKVLDGQLSVKSHYAGSYDSCLCNPVEVLGNDLCGKKVAPGRFYAVADSMEYWRVRHITAWLPIEEQNLLR